MMQQVSGQARCILALSHPGGTNASWFPGQSLYVVIVSAQDRSVCSSEQWKRTGLKYIEQL